MICFPVQAQKLISSSGGVINNNNSGSVSYSIGEPIISTISGGSNGDVTQGYQQSNFFKEINLINCKPQNSPVNNIQSFTDIIFAEVEPNAQYQYEYTDVVSGSTFYEPSNSTFTTNHYTRFANAGITDYGKTFAVRIKIKLNGQESNFGSPCYVKNTC